LKSLEIVHLTEQCSFASKKKFFLAAVTSYKPSVGVA